jgi:hypothetical protein
VELVVRPREGKEHIDVEQQELRIDSLHPGLARYGMLE